MREISFQNAQADKRAWWSPLATERGGLASKISLAGRNFTFLKRYPEQLPQHHLSYHRPAFIEPVSRFDFYGVYSLR